MARPDKGDFIDADVTEGSFKVAMGDLVDWLGDLLGSVNTYIELVRGTDGTRPAATAGGWLRWNTTNSALDISIASGVWHKAVTSVIDATWYMYLSTSLEKVARFKSTNVSDIATARVENNAGDYVEVERTATQTIVRSSGTDPIKFYIGATAVMSIDSSGNVVALGNVTANGNP